MVRGRNVKKYLPENQLVGSILKRNMGAFTLFDLENSLFLPFSLQIERWSWNLIYVGPRLGWILFFFGGGESECGGVAIEEKWPIKDVTKISAF